MTNVIDINLPKTICSKLNVIYIHLPKTLVGKLKSWSFSQKAVYPALP